MNKTIWRCIYSCLIFFIAGVISAVFAQDTKLRNYGIPGAWNLVKVYQNQNSIDIVTDKVLSTQLLARSAKVVEQMTNDEKKVDKIFEPKDIVLGALQSKTGGAVAQQVARRIRAFFSDVREGRIQKNLPDHAGEDDVVLISRQLASLITDGMNYGRFITEVRIGAVGVGDNGERNAAVRVFAINDDGVRTQGVFQVYEEARDGVWKITAIEGDFSDLIKPYDTSKKFMPSGTLGVTQGF